MPPPHTMTLKELIDKAQERHATTATSKLSKIAREAGFKTNHTTIASIRAGTYPSRPSTETLEALAFLAGVPRDVAYAAGGIEIVGGKPFAEQLPRDVDVLTLAQRDALLAVIRTMVDAQLEIKSAQRALKSNAPQEAKRIVADAYLTDQDLAPSERKQLNGSI